MAVALANYQLEAIQKLKNGSILCGGVGSGKSRTILAYYIFEICGGDIRVNSEMKTSHHCFRSMKHPRDLYIITTAKKRDSLEWEKECSDFALGTKKDGNAFSVKVTVDSWNNIKKYQNVFGAYFVFDEQRLVGSGAWVKAFLKIARKNQWNLLSATPGDQWTDYIPVFIANGFYRNKTEFTSRHCIYSRFAKYPKIERYTAERELRAHRAEILVPMKDYRGTVRHRILKGVDYDRSLYKTVFRERWDPYEEEPIRETGKLMYLIRRVVNSDKSRILKVGEIFREHQKLIVFYNFDYELEILLNFFKMSDVKIGQWNGHKHDELPDGERWIYLVQYTAGCEGWNCITTDTMVFYSLNYSYRIMEQAAGRIDRMNTPYTHLHYYILRSMAPIDVAIYRALSKKKNFNERSFIEKGFEK